MKKEALEKIKFAYDLLSCSQAIEPPHGEYDYAYFAGYYGATIEQVALILESVLVEVNNELN